MRKGSKKNCPKRKGEKASETLTDVNGESEGGSKGFFACYLLTSLSPRHKGHTYIGFTVNPKRRIRQHNGEITSGATRTKKKRPWEMILCIYGFPTQVAALQFEWAWQHPTESLAVRKAACNLKSLAGLPNKIKVAFTMLTLHTWQSMDLTVNFFSTKYMSHVAACPSLPRQMKVQFGSMDDLPCYSSDNNQSLHNDEDDWDLDPQECSGSDDGIEDLTLGNEAVANRHCYNATASFTENQADKEPQRSQEYNVFEPRDSVYLTEENTDAFTENQTDKLESQCSQEHDILEPRDTVFLVEDDDFQKDCYKVDRFDDEHNTPMRACVEKSMVIEDSDCKYVQLSAERSPLARRATDKMQSSTVGQIEVIDLFTPSPDYSKKRKVDSTRSNIIDLTRSPDFVQL